MTHFDDGLFSAGGSGCADARAMRQVLNGYRNASDRRAVLEMSVTLLPFAALWILMWTSLGVGYWLTLLLSVPAAGFLVRLFMIQHDCGHGSFFRSRRLNDWVGRTIGVLTLTPYGFWRRVHAMHHASSGNLDRRGFGDVTTLTVAEYNALGRWKRLCYRLYRHPLVLFLIGPAYLFVLQHRWPVRLMRHGWQPWLSTMGTNLAIAGAGTVLAWGIGIEAFLLVHVPIVLLAGSVGVWLFFVQHQFEQTQWQPEAEWVWHEAALHGSSHYELPAILRWFTANIGIHHVHHMCSGIPFYRLPQVLRDHPELKDLSRVTLRDSLGCTRLALWDEMSERLVTFREARRSA